MVLLLLVEKRTILLAYAVMALGAISLGVEIGFLFNSGSVRWFQIALGSVAIAAGYYTHGQRY